MADATTPQGQSHEADTWSQEDEPEKSTGVSPT